MKHVVSKLIVCTDPNSGIIKNIHTGECFEITPEVRKLLGNFKKPTNVKEFLSSCKINGVEMRQLRSFIKYLCKNKILTSYPEKNTDWGNSMVKLSDKVLVQGTKKTFLSCPSVDLKSLDKNSIVFVGVPFDLGTTGFPGTRFGPDRMRELSSDAFEYHADIFKGGSRGWYSLEYNRYMFESKQFADVGNVILQIGESFDHFFDRLGKTIDHITRKNCFPVIVGGDHSCSYPSIRSLKKKYGNLGVIHIDAHTDLGDLLPSIPNNHGNVFSRILKERLTDHLYQFGIRGMIGKVHENRRYSLHPLYQLSCEGIKKAVETLNKNLQYFISLDIDVLDPSLAPGTGTPVPFGMNIEQLKKLLSSIAKNVSIVGLDIVEVNPMLDQGDQTSNLANSLIIHILSEIESKNQKE